MARRPNLLLLIPDQHRADWLAGGDLPLRTPTLQRLAARGVTFQRAYCTSPLCAPSRASLASGRHYAHCGVPGNGHNYPLRQATFYQALRAAGYRVAGVGKFDLHKDTGDPANLWWELDGSRLLEEWGFTDGSDSEGKLDGSNSYRAAGAPRGPYLKMLHDRGLAERYLQEHATRRQHLGAYTTALPEDAYGDNWVAANALRVLDELPRWGKSTWHEAAVRVPLLVAGPGCATGAASNALVSLHDLAATFLDYAAAQPLPAMDAVSLRPLLEGRRGRHRPVAVAGLAGWRLATDGSHKLVLDAARQPLLFDRGVDPFEEHDLAAAHPEVVDRLRLHLV